jgi:glycosyltransferase involved in cell wall biosynthesis
VGAAAPDISVVVPVLDEAGNLEDLVARASRVLEQRARSYEIVIVDDGSSDGSRDVLARLVSTDPHLRGVCFGRNCGQTQAMAAGFDQARGTTIVTLDGDLQNDPADIPRLVDELDRGYDIVCGWRRNRKDSFLTRLLPSKIANALIRYTTKVPIHDTGCSLKAYRSWVVRTFNLYSEMHRFIAALAVGTGARITELPVRHHARRFGRSKYGLGRIFRIMTDLLVIKMLIQFAAHPIRWFSLLALPLLALAIALFVTGFVKVNRAGEWWFESSYDTYMITAGVVAAIVAFNVFLLGVLAELQLDASGFFRRRVSTTAEEASRWT